MAKYRIDSLASFARQLAFTPADTRVAQLAAAEQLLNDLDPLRAYPFDFVVYRITGYQPKSSIDSDLLAGSALRHDLGVLIEQVSQTLDLHAQEQAEPVLAIDDVTEKFGVTSKTIQRWRRRGLVARRLVFPDGKRRVGFLLSSVERFLLTQQDRLAPAGSNINQVQDSERDAIVGRARRLAVDGCCPPPEIARRIARHLHRSPLTILHTIRKHDTEHPETAVFPLAPQPIDDETRTRIVRDFFKRGLPLRRIARRVHLPRAIVYRVIVDQRIAKLNKRKIKFIDDTLYHDDGAEQAIGEIVAQQEIAVESRPEDSRVPRDLPPYLRELYREPLLTPARERALFLKFNFHKYQFVTARRRLDDPQFANRRDLDLLEHYLALATETKNQLLRANLRLVVSVARKHLRPGLNLMELISEGNLTLMRAVEGFDVHKGNRFSTYATLALMKGFARSVPLMLAGSRGMASLNAGDDEQLAARLADPRNDVAALRRLDRDHVRQLMTHLDDRERRVLLGHFGLADHDNAGESATPPATYDQLATSLGLTKQRVRQIEQTALAKLRTAAQSR
jgi:RNA polymerase sigma factor (sigma-70 family)